MPARYRSRPAFWRLPVPPDRVDGRQTFVGNDSRDNQPTNRGGVGVKDGAKRDLYPGDESPVIHRRSNSVRGPLGPPVRVGASGSDHRRRKELAQAASAATGGHTNIDVDLVAAARAQADGRCAPDAVRHRPERWPDRTRHRAGRGRTTGPAARPVRWRPIGPRHEGAAPTPSR